MATYIVRLYADSLVRLNAKPYFEEGAARPFAIDLPGVTVAVFDRFIPVGDVSIPSGLILQVGLEASGIDEAVAQGTEWACYFLSMFSCVTLASVDKPRAIWAYDASPGVEDREYRHFGYHDTGTELNTRQIDDGLLFALLDGNFKLFIASATIPEDYKERVQRAIQSFRRGLADNDDVLTEFIIAWSSMEGLDCVYRKVLPSARTRDFRDGVRDVLDRLGRADMFDALNELRNGLAHGSISLADASRTANANLELVRQAFVLMILRILGVEEAVANKVLTQPGYKGIAPFIKLLATIRFEPGDVKRLDGHPVVETKSDVKAIRQDGKLTLQPTWNLTPQNLKEGGMTCRGFERAIDPGARVGFGAADAKVVPAKNGS